MKYALLGILALAAIHYINRNWRKWWYRNDVQFPAPLIKRTDLLFGYFGCQDEQVAETKGSVNLLHEIQFDGPEKCIQNILDAGVPCMLDLTNQLFEQGNNGKTTVRPAAERHLTEFFARLQARGALQFVKYLSPTDEPNNTVADHANLVSAVAAVHLAADKFPELAGYKLVCIYAADKEFIGQSMFDIVGFDDYDMKSSVLVGKKYKALKASLLAHQRTLIIPGGCYGQDPTPFVNFAQANQEVAIVMPFLWFDDKLGDVGTTGIRSQPIRAAYLAAGQSICNTSGE